MRTYYCRANENRVAALTPTLEAGTLAASSSLAYAADGNPARLVVIATTAGGARLTYDLGSALAVPVVTIHNPIGLYGATVTLQAHTSTAWGDPGVLSTVVTMLDADADGLYPDIVIDRAGLADRRFVSLLVAGAGATIAFGQFWAWAARREFLSSGGLEGVGQEQPEGAPTIVHPTGLDVELAYQRSTRRTGVSTQVMTDFTGWPELQAHGQVAGWRARPWPIIPPLVPGATVARAELVRLQQDAFVPRYRGGLIVVPFSIRSLARGLAA